MSVKIRAWMGVLKQQVMRNESMKIVVLGGRQDENEVLPVNKIQTDDDDTVCVRFMGGLISFYSIHQSRLSYKRLAWNYMVDIALAYGRQVENLLDQGGSLDSGVLEHILMNANLEGVESSYTYIVDSEGNMLYHPNKDKIGKSVENVIVKSYIQDLKSGIKHDTYVVEYDYNGSIKYAACYTDETDVSFW